MVRDKINEFLSEVVPLANPDTRIEQGMNSLAQQVASSMSAEAHVELLARVDVLMALNDDEGPADGTDESKELDVLVDVVSAYEKRVFEI